MPDPRYTLDVLSAFSDLRMRQSVAQNPYYFRGFVGAFIPAGTHALIVRMFSNHTGPDPNATLDRATLKSFYSITGGPDSASLVYTPGYEQIPANWYKRAVGSEYGVANFGLDLNTIDSAHPGGVAFGGNTGTVNPFTGLNVSDLTVRAASLLSAHSIPPDVC